MPWYKRIQLELMRLNFNLFDICHFNAGEQQVETGTSCSSLKQSGYFKSGYYNIKEAEDKKIVFCDMGTETYDDVSQSDELVLGTSVAPIGTILAWTMKVGPDGNQTEDIPAGWVRCDGSTIPPPSIWAGERTPNLNTAGRFLRGGSDETVLTLEEDMVQDHQHGVNDPGHTHPSPYKYELAFACGSVCGADYSSPSSQETIPSSTTGISVTGISNGYRYGDETRPRNMHVVYIMRVY